MTSLNLFDLPNRLPQEQQLSLKMTVNGDQVITQAVSARTSLADVLRDYLNLTGTHLGCEHGVCGAACTVLVQARSCITLAAARQAASIQTIEGFDGDPLMEQLRDNFKREHALQCGYCTPGMLFAAYDLVSRKELSTPRDIRLEMSGNLCRCTGYVGIFKAVERTMRLPSVNGKHPALYSKIDTLPRTGRCSCS